MTERHVVLIPAYEPEPVLIELLSGLKELGFDIVVVDDGSGPGYAALLNEASKYACILSHAENRGKGAALKTGLSHILERFGTDCVVVTLDADGQHSISDAEKVCRAAALCPGALTLGSRELPSRGPLRSRFGNAVTKRVFALSSGLFLRDTQTGLRAFGGRLIPRLLAAAGSRYEYEMNMLLELAREKTPIREVPVEALYFDNNASSHFDVLRDSARIYAQIIKFSLSSVTGFAVDYAVYVLLLFLTSRLVLANVGARVVSAAVNYTLNRKLVFKSSGPVLVSAARYFVLAAFILCGNTLVLKLLADFAGIDRLAAKLLTELLFFFVSFAVQRRLIFKTTAGNQRVCGKFFR